ncbi:adenylosuccinate synthase [soil metagenome]
MPATCVVGLQWGDEAKGKIVDILSDAHDFVVRYNGGANAGHTVVWGDRKFALSLLPTGVLKPHVKSVIGNGVVVYPPRFIEEVTKLRDAGISIGSNLIVSDHAHVIFPWHMEEERLAEADGEGKLGTTGRGIGPCYQDKVGRRYAIRVGELLHPEHFRERLNFIVPFKNRMLKGLSNEAKTFDVNQIADDYSKMAETLKPHVTDTVHLLHDGLAANKKILFEAAQGSLLDVDHGTYPYVTSSHSLPGGIANGSGVPARQVSRILGVAKAYTSRVGRGPFPTELDNEIGERIRTIGREFGTVTGRPRRCGWFDTVAVKYTAAIAGVDEITLMLLDVLSGLDEVKICTGYQFEGELTQRFPSDAWQLEKCKPVYETLPGWGEDLTKCRKPGDLPANARKYVDRISEILGKPITIVSVGPDRDQTIAMS